MRFRNTIRKIVALGTGATMLGATILGASAAGDLAMYPKPFVDAGKFNGFMVVGDQAKALDVIGVTDIATSLQYASSTPAGTTSGGTVTVTGDAWQVGTSSKHLEMTESRDSSAVHFENLYNITNFIDETELDALADGEVSTEKGTSKYNQYIFFDNRATEYVVYTENDDDVSADFFHIASGQDVLRFQVEFTTSFKSDVEDSSGASSTTGTYLGDYEGESLKLFGKDYSIVKARRTNAAGRAVELTLMGGAIRDTLEEGSSKTYTINGKEYLVEVTIVDDNADQAKFTVNGEVTRALKGGDTYKLSDGTEFGIKDILPNEAGDVTQDMVEFYLGASKVFLKDTSVYGNPGYSNALEVGSETIDDTYVSIEGTDDNSTFSIDVIRINVTADDDFFVPVGGKLSAQMEEPDALLDSVDMEYKGLEDAETETYRIKTSSSSKYNLEVVDGAGEKATIPFVYTSSGSNLKLGDDDDDLIVNENNTISKNDYLLLTDSTQDAGDRQSWALRYKGSAKSSADNPVVKFDNVANGNRIEKTYTVTTDKAEATLRLGGQNFLVRNMTGASVDDFNVRVDLDGDGAYESNNTVAFTTNYGLEITFSDNHTTNVAAHTNITFKTPDTDDFESLTPGVISFNISASSGEVTLADLAGGSPLNYRTPSGEDNIGYTYTSMGAMVKLETPTSDPGLVTITYPKKQRYPQVFITTPTASVATSGEAGAESVVVSKIDVGATKLASEVASVAAQNLILVGGPCANSVTAEVMGSPADCASGFEAGKGVIALYDNGAYQAMVVAGFAAEDTRAATTVVANYGDYKLSGSRMVVTRTSTGGFEVAEEAAPVMAAAPAAVPETTV